MTSELTKTKRRVKQLESCLRDVQKWIFLDAIELNESGMENLKLERLTKRIRRTLCPGCCGGHKEVHVELKSSNPPPTPPQTQ